jgi:serine/threonine protein kinase
MSVERMEGKQSKRIRDLCMQALKRPADERDAFVRAQCANHPELAEEASRVLRALDEMTMPDIKSEHEQTLVSELEARGRAFAAGDVLAGRFRIVRFISSGGMGEVYAAEDLQLGGPVAIKTIRSDYALTPNVAERFRQEIALGLRITHPNVCRLFDIESHKTESGEVVFLTMELLEGETLESWISRHGGVSRQIAAPIVLQMLRGLKAAHQVGIIHGDFKPNNVFLVPEPDDSVRAVVMDFGLSLLASASKAGAASEVAGTPLYMAPELLAGQSSSIASDLYSVGIVIHELITGEKPTPGEGRTRLLQHSRGKFRSAAQHKPDIDERWCHVIGQCLSANPKDRPQSVDEVIEALRLEALSARPVTWKQRALLAATVLVLIGGLTVWLRRGGSERIDDLTQVTSELDLSADPSLSADGKTIAYESDRGEPGNLDVWIQTLPNGAARRITTNPAEDDDTNLSQDGKQVVFHSDRNGGGIYIADTKRGPERLLAPFGHRPRFSPDGKNIVYWTGEYDDYIPSGQIYVIPAAGGPVRRVAADFVDARYAIWSPDGQWILFTGCRQVKPRMPLSTCQDWWITSLDSSHLFDTGALALLRKEKLRIRYWPCAWTKQGVFFSAFKGEDSNIWLLGLSQRPWRVEGKPKLLTSGAYSAVDATVASDGSIAFGRLGGAVHIWEYPLTAGRESASGLKLTTDPHADIDPSVPRDGQFVVYSRGGKQGNAIWIKDLKSEQETKLASPRFNNVHPVVSFSGKQVAFEADDELTKGLYVTGLDGKARIVCNSCANPTGWFDHDKYILFTNGDTGQIDKVDVSNGNVSTVLAKEGVTLGDGTWSPETQYLLFTVAKRQGQRQIFAVKLAASSGTAEGEWIPVTSNIDWSDSPGWSADGSTVFFLSNRDTFSCVWARKFDAEAQRMGTPFAVVHFHNPHSNPGLLTRSRFKLSVSRESLILDIAEVEETIWRGVLKSPRFPTF